MTIPAIQLNPRADGLCLDRCAFCHQVIGDSAYTKNTTGGVLHFDGRDCMRERPVLVRRELSYPANWAGERAR